MLRAVSSASEMPSSLGLILGKYFTNDGRSSRPPVTPWSYPKSLVWHMLVGTFSCFPGEQVRKGWEDVQEIKTGNKPDGPVQGVTSHAKVKRDAKHCGGGGHWLVTVMLTNMAGNERQKVDPIVKGRLRPSNMRAPPSLMYEEKQQILLHLDSPIRVDNLVQSGRNTDTGQTVRASCDGSNHFANQTWRRWIPAWCGRFLIQLTRVDRSSICLRLWSFTI